MNRGRAAVQVFSQWVAIGSSECSGIPIDSPSGVGKMILYSSNRLGGGVEGL